MTKRRTTTLDVQTGVESEAQNTVNARGPKLTERQRAALHEVIALFDDVATIRQVLAEEQPGFPHLSDEAIRYHRRQINSDITKAAQAARSQALTTGLARREVRVAHLGRLHQRLVQQVLTPATAAAQIQTLQSIARETGDVQPSVVITNSNTLTSAAGATTITTDSDRAQLLAEFRERLHETIEHLVTRRLWELEAEAGLPPYE